MPLSKTRKPPQRWGIMNTGARSKFGDTLETSQGPVKIDKDLVGVKNEEQMQEVAEKYKGFVQPVHGDRPWREGERVLFSMPELPWKRRNRLERQEREEEESERRFDQDE